MAKRLAGRVAYVTGAASGIGLACSQRFADEGAIVVGADITTTTEGDVEFPGELHELDVRDAAAQAELVDAAAAEHGRMDIVVTAAGVACGGMVHSMDLDEWQRGQDINLTGTMLSARAALPHMIAAKSGSIITVASVEGLEGCEGGSTYNASKGGVILLTKNLAIDYGRSGIRANSICPGFIDTPMFQSVVPHLPYADSIRDQHKLGRFGRPEEIAGAAYFLASDDSSFVSGVALPVDGGYTAGHWFGMAQAFNLQ